MKQTLEIYKEECNTFPTLPNPLTQSTLKLWIVFFHIFFYCHMTSMGKYQVLLFLKK